MLFDFIQYHYVYFLRFSYALIFIFFLNHIKNILTDLVINKMSSIAYTFSSIAYTFSKSYKKKQKQTSKLKNA